MKAKTIKNIYGQTWWGEKWLDLLEDISFLDIQTTAKRYARTGRVKRIKFEDNTITSKVTDSYQTTYDVELTLKAFSEEQKNTIYKIIKSSPSILSQLLNNKLPVKLFEQLNEQGIILFPQFFSDVKGYCDCYYHYGSYLCSHIGSLIYMLSTEIDRNPFLIFDLHDCNLKGLLNDFQVSQSKAQPKIQSIDQLSKVQKTDLKTPKKTLTKKSQPLRLQDISFSHIPDLENHIESTLTDHPIFFEDNFRNLLMQGYRCWKKEPLARVLINLRNTIAPDPYKTEEENFILKWGNPEKLENFKLTLDQNHNLILINDESIILKNNSYGKLLNIGLTRFLHEIPLSYLHRLNPELRFIHLLYQFVVKLIEKSAFIPQILRNKKEFLFIRWIPALFDESVSKVFKELVSLCPDNLITVENKSLSPEEQVKAAIATLLYGCVSFNFFKPLQRHLKSHVFKMFFEETPYKFKAFHDKEIPGAIEHWLSRLYLIDKPYKLYLMIKDKEDEFKLDIKVSSEDQKSPLALQTILKSNTFKHKLSVLSDISILCEYLPGLEQALDTKKSLVFNLEEFEPIFLNILPILKATGVQILLPRSLQKIFKPKLNLNVYSPHPIANDRESFLNLTSILQFDWQIAIGDKKISISDFKKLLKNSRGLVRIADEYVMLDAKEMHNLLKKTEKLPQELNKHDLMQAALCGEIDGADVEMDQKLEALFQGLSKIDPIKVPSNLKAHLRPYQERGFSWLVQNIQTSFGSILADDMGLGKTLQVITTILHYKNAGILKKERVLIVAPTTLLSNWQKEIQRFAPEITTFIYHGQNRKLITDYDVVITSYGIARRDQEDLNKTKWFLLIIDEAQNIKNPNTEQTKSIKSLTPRNKIALTGTPVENRLLEYWSIFDFTNKRYLGSAKDFQNKFAGPIEKDRDQECLTRFSKITSPFILRRLKSDKNIIKDLPDKIENNHYCSLTVEQTAFYQEVVDITMKQITRSKGIERKGLILKLINSLKQICNHPAQYYKKKNPLIPESGKMQSLENLLTSIDDLGEKTLIFTQYTAMGEIISKLIEERFDRPVPFLYGDLTRKKRDEIVHDFQNLSQTKTLIVSLKAGGTGLNLTAANHVIHYDLWWNPAVEAQATDRAYRIGQKSNVMVHRLITSGTFEERIDAMIQSKKELADLAVSSGESWITEMNDTELTDIFNLRKGSLTS